MPWGKIETTYISPVEKSKRQKIQLQALAKLSFVRTLQLPSFDPAIHFKPTTGFRVFVQNPLIPSIIRNLKHGRSTEGGWRQGRQVYGYGRSLHVWGPRIAFRRGGGVTVQSRMSHAGREATTIPGFVPPPQNKIKYRVRLARTGYILFLASININKQN